MKIAVIKLGARITWDTDGAVAPGEAISICKALARGGAEVHVFTKILKKDTLHPSLHWHNIGEDHDASKMDLVVVINGNVNFFGGQEDVEQILNYKLINSTRAFVCYIMCDPYLPFQQIWANVNKKQTEGKWNSKWTREELLINRAHLYVLSQPYATEKVWEDWDKIKSESRVMVADFFHFPMERFPLLNDWLPPNPTPSVDLLYGGTHRGGRRIPNLYKWYWNLPPDISTELYGNIALDDFIEHPKVGPKASADVLKSDYPRAPKFAGKVKYDQVLPKQNTGLAHLVTGDPDYEPLDIIPQRTYENIAAGNVVFVDANMDPSRRIYPKGTLANEFLYVATQDELVERLRAIKQDPALRQQILAEQIAATNWDADKFCKDLVAKLKWKCT